MMAKVDTFLDSLINFNKEKIPEACLKAIQPYLQVSVQLALLIEVLANAVQSAMSAAWQAQLISHKFSRGVITMTMAHYGCQVLK